MNKLITKILMFLSIISLFYTSCDIETSNSDNNKEFVEVFGTDNPKTAISLNNLAELLNKKGDYDRAEPLFRRAIAIFAE